ncbi:hypothetical protein LTR08_000257 [Meristemomyces frigidus]|nr:hypothetical protein LTR08_000257 [Meristemomyces frigidus]
MSGVATKQSSSNLAGNKRRSLSGQGGLLNRMFGSSGGSGSNGKDSNDTAVAVDGPSDSPPASANTATGNQIASIDESKDEMTSEVRGPRKSLEDVPATEKKRRSSGVGRAREMFSSAKQSLRDNLSSPPEQRSATGPQTPMQKLGRTDPALAVPQGSLNNSAGESVPGPRSTFRVGVSEDKNKKCRRTMEDTHAYLYNFLSTPAPALSSDSSSKNRGSLTESTSALSTTSSQGIVETDNGYFAIFDGHAGTFAADWCGKKVHLLLEDVIRKHPNTPIPELLDMTFTSVDQQLERLPLKNSGCTAVIAVLRWEDRIPNSLSATGTSAIAPAVVEAVIDQKPKGGEAPPPVEQSPQEMEVQLRREATRNRVLYTANVGDARIVLCRNGKALRLSYDHKGSDENEGKRIAGAGGLILNNRVNGVLAVTRALGDAYMKDLVTGHPYTTETVVQPDIDEFLILACDGLWDVCSDQEAVDLVRNTHDPQAASRALVDHALARFSTDNLSIMVVRFDSRLTQQTVANQTEPIGVEGDRSTNQGSLTEAEAIVLESKKKLDETGGSHDKIPSSLLNPHVDRHAEPGPELNAEAVEKARFDNRG